MNDLSSPPRYTALVVDDNFYNRDIFRYALEMAGYEVSEAEDGVQSLNLLEQRGFDLMILDLQMPRMDGREVLRRVRSRPGLKALRIVVVTANAHMIVDDMDDLADFVLQKPIDVLEFATLVGRVKRSIPLRPTSLPPLTNGAGSTG